MNLCAPEACTGCLACVNSCPKTALSVKSDPEGFYIPVVDERVCIDCGICEKRCPVLNPLQKEPFEQHGFACWSKEKNLRKASSSGGLFSELASIIIKKGGTVFGASFDKNFNVIHTAVSTSEELNKLRGSKYVQSYIGSSYQQVKELLNKEVPVLFVGTPCQVAGLRSFLHKGYETLVTCDLVCHGVPSPLVFQSYKKWLERKYKSPLETFSFRDKRKSWMWYNTKATFHSGDKYIGSWFSDPFMRLFLRDNILRPSCYNCQYTNMKRAGDITIADFWGYRSKEKGSKNTDKGVSLALINTPQGAALYEESKANLTSFPRSTETIALSQKSFSTPWSSPPERTTFWADYARMPFDAIINKYAYRQKRNFAQYVLSEWGKNTLTTFVIWTYHKYNGAIHRIKTILKQ